MGWWGQLDNNLRKRFPGGYNMQRLEYNNNNNIYRLAREQGGIQGCIDDRSATLLTITKFNSISMSFWCSDRASTAMAALHL